MNHELREIILMSLIHETNEFNVLTTRKEILGNELQITLLRKVEQKDMANPIIAELFIELIFTVYNCSLLHT